MSASGPSGPLIFDVWSLNQAILKPGYNVYSYKVFLKFYNGLYCNIPSGVNAPFIIKLHTIFCDVRSLIR